MPEVLENDSVKLVNTVIQQQEMAQAKAKACGLSTDAEEDSDLRLDQFRLKFGHAPPVKVAPLEVRLRSDEVPARAGARRFLPNDREFLDRSVGI